MNVWTANQPQKEMAGNMIMQNIIVFVFGEYFFGLVFKNLEMLFILYLSLVSRLFLEFFDVCSVAILLPPNCI